MNHQPLRRSARGALVTVEANGNPDAFGTQPAHIRVERYVSQDHVLPHAASVSRAVRGVLSDGEMWC